MKLFAQLLLVASSLALAASAQAHHSFAATFSEDVIEVEGVVTEFSFRNPHVLVYIDVTSDDGTVTNWMSEGAAATLYRRSGWDTQTFNPGDLVRVTGNSTHDGSPMVSIDVVSVLNPVTGAVVANLSRANGGNDDQEPVKAAAMPLELDNGIPNLTGAWTSHGMARNGPRGIPMEFSDLGNMVQAKFNGANDPQIFCDEPGLVRQIQTPHPYRITQYEDRVVFEYEEYAGRREVYFDGRNALGIRSNFGDSIARYEGSSLVVETTNLMSNPTAPAGNALSDSSVIVERYQRTDSDTYGPVVALSVDIDDVLYLSEDANFVRTKMSAGEYEFIENDCQQPLRERTAASPAMNFFLTSNGPGDGANLGGLEGADAHCEALAATVGQGDKNWVAYLSATGVNAADRIGDHPIYNAKGAIVSFNSSDLHGEASHFMKSTVVDEHGQIVNGRGDTPNRHDILTGSDVNGMAVTSDSDTTCSNWTSNGEGSALVGHFDRQGGGDNPTSWNSAHASSGCGQSDLQGTGGDGLFYCFATGE